jgi:hypothetical protein
MDVPIQPKIKVALYLIFQFESMDFSFEKITAEAKLQLEYEALEKEEVMKLCGDKGVVALKKAYPNDEDLGSDETSKS